MYSLLIILANLNLYLMGISIIFLLFYQLDIFIIFLFQFILVVICSSIFCVESLDYYFVIFFFRNISI